MARAFVVENPRPPHLGLVLLRAFAFALVAAAHLPPLVILGTYVKLARDLPELRPMAEYYAELKAPSTFHAADGQVIGEFFEERRLFLPVEDMPIRLVQAFLATEDERLFEHQGIDPRGVLRALVTNVSAGRTVQGASTLTQQLAKAMLGAERTYKRKVREMILARRMEDVYSKSEILTLYLNQIYLGHNSYGVQAAAQNYFRKNVSELSLGEIAIMAGLPASPSKINPVKNLKKTLERRKHVLTNMVRAGFLTADAAEAAKAEVVRTFPLLDEFGDRSPLAAADARAEVVKLLGDAAAEDDAWMGLGLKVETTIELDLQHATNGVLSEEVEAVDKKQGWRGPIGRVSADQIEAWLRHKDGYDRSRGLVTDEGLAAGATLLGVIDEVTEEQVQLRLGPKQPYTLERKRDLAWAGPYREYPLVTYELRKRPKGGYDVTKLDLSGKALAEARPLAFASPYLPADRRDEEVHPEELRGRDHEDVIVVKKRDESVKVSWKPVLEDCTTAFERGDVVMLRVGSDGASVALVQPPAVQGAVLTWNPWTGYVRAMVGGTDFDASQVNRTRSLRQTGSTMKPIYYALAYDLGMPPSTPISDAPYVEGGFKSTGGSSDTTPLLAFLGLAKSRNTVSLRIHEYVMNHLKDKAQLDSWRTALGLGRPLEGHRAEILGGDQSMWDMSTAYARFVTGGLEATPVLVRRVTDRTGKVWLDRSHPSDPMLDVRDTVAAMYRVLYERRARVVHESTAYVMKQNLRAVITKGTSHRAMKMGRMAGGKTGTLPFDVWFNGFTGHDMTATWIGQDRRERILGKSKQKAEVMGGGPPLSIFMKAANLAAGGRPDVDFLKPAPPTVEMVTVDLDTGARVEGAAKGEAVAAIPHRRCCIPTYVKRGEGSTDDIHHAEHDF